MLVRDIMSKDVFTVREDKRLFVASEIMDWAHLRHVPVVDRHQRVVGMISHRDVLRASLSAVGKPAPKAERCHHLAQATVLEIMHRPVHTIEPSAEVQEAAGLMRRLKIGALPVLEEERLVGIVTEHDLLQVLEHLPAAALSNPRTAPPALE